LVGREESCNFAGEKQDGTQKTSVPVYVVFILGIDRNIKRQNQGNDRKIVYNIGIIHSYLVVYTNNNYICMEERIFERKIYSEMLEWKQQNDGRSALMIEGARHIGKSTNIFWFTQRICAETDKLFYCQYI